MSESDNLIEFTKSITPDTIEYMRLYFDENFAAYSIMSKYKGYDISSGIDDSGAIYYKVENAEKDELDRFIQELNGNLITVYGTTYTINVSRAGSALLMSFVRY